MTKLVKKSDHLREFCKHHNSAQNYQTGPKFEHDLKLLMIKLYTNYQINIFNNDKKKKKHAEN